MSTRSKEPLKTGQIMGPNGQILTGDAFRKHCESKGLCPICGHEQVRKRKGLSRSWSNIAYRLAPNGTPVVYQGYHIASGCYQLDDVRVLLGEIPDPSGQRQNGREHKELSNSDRSRDHQQGYATLNEPGNSYAPSDGDRKPSASRRSRSSRVSRTSGLDTTGHEQHPSSPTLGSSLSSNRTSGSEQLSGDDRVSFTSRLGSHTDSYTSGGGTGSVVSPPCEGRLSQSFSEESSEEAIIRKLEQLVSNHDVYQFVTVLDGYRAKAEVARRGLQLLRELVFKIHQTDPGRRYVFPSDTWCKTIKFAMSDHAQDARIQEESATTITFVCSISNAYKVELVSNQNANEVVAAMKALPSVVEVCSVALESLTRTVGTIAEWQEKDAETAFDGIKSILSGSEREGTSYAILALYNLTCHKNFRTEFVVDHMRVIFADSDVTKTFAAVLNEDSGPDEMVKALVSLLSHYWVRFIDDSVGLPGNDCSPSVLVGALLGALYTNDSVALHEAICELLSVVHMRPDSDISWNEALDAVSYSMSSHTPIESVQLVGLSAVCNLFRGSVAVAMDGDSAVELDQVVEVVIFAMSNFARNPGLQAKGCLALASICSRGDRYKEMVVRKRGIAAASNAFKVHVVDVGNGTAPSEDVKVAASSVLGSLALSDVAIPILQESNLLTDFRVVLARDGLSADQNACVKTCIINLISAAFGESDSPSNTDRRRSSDVAVEYEFVTQFLLQDANEDDVKSSFEALDVICSRSPAAIDVVLSSDGGEGTIRIADLMGSYLNNASIQETGCSLLLKIYYQIPFQGELEQSSDVALGSGSVRVRTHSEREILVLRSALENHKSNVEVVINACEALCNFICGLNVVTSDPDQVQVPEEVMAQFSTILAPAQQAMTVHGENTSAMLSLLRLVLVAVRIHGDDKIMHSINVIAQILNAMIRFPRDNDIHLCACSILGRYLSLDNRSIDSCVTSSDGTSALFTSLRLENEAVVSSSITILSTLLQRVRSLSDEITENKDFVIGRLIDCMFRYVGSETIQAEACSILSTLAMHHRHTKATIANEGGILAIMSAMKTHRGQAYVLEYASKALGSIAEGIPNEIFASERENICIELVDSLDRNSNMEGVSWATLSSLCAYCDRDDDFANQVVQEDAVPLIVNVLPKHLASESVQSEGCRLLSILGSKNSRNMRVIEASGADGVLASALLAHIRSRDIVMNALKTLGSIARVSTNREALHQTEIIDGIRLSVDANLDDASLVSAGLLTLNDIGMQVLSESTLKRVMEAMKLHGSNAEVQASACCLLRSSLGNTDNLLLMRHFQEDLFEILWTASVAFPDKCGPDVQHILGTMM